MDYLSRPSSPHHGRPRVTGRPARHYFTAQRLHACHKCCMRSPPFKLLSPPTGRVSLVRTTSLRLEALQLDDQGSYDCRILLLNESADELQNGTWILLSVTGEDLNLGGYLFIYFFCFLTLPLWLRVDYIELCEASALIQMQNVNNILAPVACLSKDRRAGRRVFHFQPNSYDRWKEALNKHLKSNKAILCNSALCDKLLFLKKN